MEFLIICALFLAAILGWAAAIYFYTRYYRLLAEVERRAKQMFDDWKNQREQEIKEQARWEYQQQLDRVREEAIQRSGAVQRGQVMEQAFPFLVGLDPTSVRYLGQPVDFLVFRGLEESSGESSEDVEIVLVEVKTGKSQENDRQRRLRRAIESGRAHLRWQTVRLERDVEEKDEERRGWAVFKVRIRQTPDRPENESSRAT